MKVEEKRWKPEKGEMYWYVWNDGNACWGDFTGTSDERRFKSGNCFKTEEEAKAAAEKVKALLLSLHSEPVTDCNQLPKLTAEVFDRPDCPEWAKWVAVTSEGNGIYLSDKPYPSDIVGVWHGAEHWAFIKAETGGILKCNASDWQNSLVERPAKLPDWCKVDAIGWHKRCGHFKVTYIDDVSKRVDIQQIDDKSRGYFSFRTVCNETVQARLRPYNANEMRGLVGKVVQNGRNLYSVTAYIKELQSIIIASLSSSPLNAELLIVNNMTIDGKPCGCLEHLENGEWVR